MEREDQREWVLRKMSVDKVWGIGRRLKAHLADLKIETAWDLANANTKLLRRKFSVNLERTVAELNGEACLELEEHPPAKKQIYCTRGFGVKATSLPPIKEAVSLYASRAAEKLRRQQHLATTLHVFIQTSPYDKQYYSRSTVVQLPYPTNDTRLISHYARYAAEQLYKPGFSYLKAGVGIIEMIDRRYMQSDMFELGQPKESDQLMALLDGVNRRYGRGTIQLASDGIKKKWFMRQQYRSPSYTTNLFSVPSVHI